MRKLKKKTGNIPKRKPYTQNTKIQPAISLGGLCKKVCSNDQNQDFGYVSGALERGNSPL
jgi:hypothetical protein